MNKTVKKILVVLPVLILTFLFLKANYRDEYRHAGAKRLFLFLLTIVILYAWILYLVAKRKQNSFWQVVLQSSFFVYVFMVLTLTGYFILFRELTYNEWWERMLMRIERRDHVNFDLMEIFRIYKITDKQILGNFVMLLPLGIYLPLLYKNLSGFIPVLLVSLLVAILIEVLQLATSFRSVDIDDVLLNTTGAVIGFILYKIISSLIKPTATVKADG
jgi:glycopeptide antibiotics resistance protein